MSVKHLSLLGNWFHRVGPATANDRCSKVTLLVLGTLRYIILCCWIGWTIFPNSNSISSMVEFLRREYPLEYTLNISQIYLGADPWMPLKVNNSNLNMILYDTGSQCNWTIRGVTWENLGSWKTSLAAIFWIRCSFLIWYSGRLCSRPLQ